MVFESVVVEMINRYLGAFVENLDKSQLSIGLWPAQQGDVILKNLNMKESALDSFNLPVRIKAGHLGKLTLKIPWKKLYTEPVVVHMEDLYVLALPDIVIKYDEEIDKQAKIDEKQARLTQIELQKKWEKERDKPSDAQQDSFVEKLATQIIKNLQIKVSSLHIRYEDTFTKLNHPISVGFTLQELVFQTTDSTWKATVIKEAVSQIYKSALADSIPKQGSKSNFHFLFQPISAVAHLRLNTKPELMNLAVPKIQLTLVFDEITITLSKDQFDDILETLEAFERLSLVNKYKASRPGVPFKNNAKLWWNHAYVVVLKYTVQRRRNMWKWNNIKKHRGNMKVYRDLYTNRLDGKKLGKTELDMITKLEEELDVFSICLCRNQAELDVARYEKQRLSDKNLWSLWSNGWFVADQKPRTGSLIDRRSSTYISLEINEKLNQEFTDEEKGKLYNAIGYDENANDPTFPYEFVSMRLIVKLNKLSLVLLDDKNTKEESLLTFILTEICASFGQRPAANAIRLDLKVDQLRAVGVKRYDYLPKLINSVGVSKQANISLLNLTLETNPLGGMCDTRIKFQSRPLEIIYDAVTVNSLAEFFTTPESVRLKQLSYAAMARYDEIISQTAAGVVYMMSERKYADVDVHLMPSYIILPETGELKKDVKMLLLNLGSLKITSEKTSEIPTGMQLSPKDLASYAYDKFNVSIDNVQLLFVQPGDTWKDEDGSVSSPLYILRPMSIQLLLEKCLFTSDPNLPQFQVSGELPLVAVTVSDNKLMAIMNLIQSIPVPGPGQETKLEEDEIFDDVRMTTLDITRLQRVNLESKLTSEFKNLTQLSMTFIIKEVSLEIRETIGQTESPFLQLIITRIGANIKARSFDLSVEVYLGGIYLKHLQFKISENIRQQLKKCQVVTGENVNIINSPFVDSNEPLLSIRFIQANKKGPEFKTTYNNTTQSVTVEFSTLDVVLHQGVILSLLDFAKKLEPTLKNQLDSGPDVMKRTLSAASYVSQQTAGFIIIDKSKPHSDVLLLKVKAIVDSIQLGICNAKCVIMHSKVEGIEFGIGMQHQTVGVTTVMRKIEVVDPDPQTLHSKIFSVRGTDMLKLEMTLFMDSTEGKQIDSKNVDAILSLKMGRTQIKFVNKFFMSIVHFFDNFIVAKAKLDEARKAVAEASLDAAKNLHEKVPRVKLDVMIKAPLIVVPQSSRSRSVLNIHLGDIMVQNTFEYGAIRTMKPPQNIWIVEAMMVKLTNLCISRGFAQDERSTLAAEITILEPLTFIVDIRRNLSYAYYHAIPSVQVKGVLEKIEIKMNQEDVRLFMQIATENIDERYADGPLSAKARLVIVQGKNQYARHFSNTSIRSKTLQISKETYVDLKLEFQLLAINIELYRGFSSLVQATKSPDRLLTYLTLKTMKFIISMTSDTSMAATVCLHDISMDDCRSEMAGGITKLVRRTAFKNLTRAALKVREKEDMENMVIHVKFDQNSTLDKTIKIHICSLHLCMSVEFMMKVAEFFIKAVPVKDPADAEGNTQEMKAVLEHKDDVNPFKDTSLMEGSIDLSLKLQKPEIYFIDDQMNPHTDSFIINLELVFHVYMSADILNVNGGLNKFSVVSCIFEKESNTKSYLKYFKWSQDKTRQISHAEKELLEICYNYYEHKWEMLPILNYVLTPLDITILGSGQQNRNHHVDINVTDFIISVTPSTVHLLTAMTGRMTITPDTEALPPTQKNYLNIWDKQLLANCKYWFLESVIEIVPDKISKIELSSPQSVLDMLVIQAPIIVLKLEGGVGHRTVPLFIVESSISSQIHNWTSDMYFMCKLGIEIAYNNENFGVWEPILEPILDPRTSTFHKWDFLVEITKNPNELDQLEQTLLPPAKTMINIVTTEPLQLVMSKTCLNILHQLRDAYSEASNLKDFEGTLGQQILPYHFRNRLGRDIVLIPDASFESILENTPEDFSCFQTGKDIYMNVSNNTVGLDDKSIIRAAKPEEKIISFKIVDNPIQHDVHIKQAKKRVFMCNKEKVVVSVEIFISQKRISFISILQFKNQLNVPMEILYKQGSTLISAGEVFPTETFHVPLDAVDSLTGELFLQPKTEELCFAVSTESVKWKLLTDKTIEVNLLSCNSNNAGQSTYYFCVSAEFEKLYKENTQEHADHFITLQLCPALFIHNLLPFSLNISIQGTQESYVLEAGVNIPLNHASTNKSVLLVEIMEYRGHRWNGSIQVHKKMPDLSILAFESQEDKKPIFMDLGIHCKHAKGSLDITIYSPYWIVNLTDRDIALKVNEKDTPLVHMKDDKQVMLFYYSHSLVTASGGKDKATYEEPKGCCASCRSCCKCQKNMFKRQKKVRLKITNSKWSKTFSLDTAGSSGNVICKTTPDGNNLEVGVKIKLASSALTKIVTFTPFYLLINDSTTHIKVRENNNFDWTDLQPGECKGFYPVSNTKEMKLIATVEGSACETVPFLINRTHTTLLRLDNIIGGISAECQVNESAMITTFKTYTSGMATALFINHVSDYPLIINQVGIKSMTVTLEPMTSQLYTWTDPTAKREILWTCGKKKNVRSTLDRDKFQEFSLKGDVKVYFVSFLDGLQRVVMLTENLTLATLALEAGELEQADQEINIRICEVGFSLINNDKMVELAYMGITSSGLVWEENRKKQFKPVKPKEAEIMEKEYQKHYLTVNDNSIISSSLLENNIEFDFELMRKIRPYACPIRRSFEPGIWIQLRQSYNAMNFHAKIYRLQFDNQLRDCTFTTILSSTIPARSIAAVALSKPFIEVGLIIKIHQHSDLLQIKYFKVLIQEMNVNVDQSFINGLLDMFASDVLALRETELTQFKDDLALTMRELEEEAGVSIQASRVSFFDFFHISPIKIHVSFSLQGVSTSSSHHINPMDVFLQSVGLVLTDVHDVVFKLGYFEKSYCFINDSKLMREFIIHYTGQAIKQMYVLVLGLDVLGNPFGLLRGLTEGIEDLFYEPYQGAIQGPEEFAKGLAFGFRSLFGHTVGGTAGAMSSITKTLGKSLAALSMDEEYQKKRREQHRKIPASAIEGFALGGKEMVMGVYDGLTGIVRQPYRGARKGGVLGFLLGISKGLIGVIVKPVSGVMAFASSSLEGIRRITDVKQEIRHLRPPRMMSHDGVIHPFIYKEAEGYNLLLDTDKGTYGDTDSYITHAMVKTDGKIIFLITDKRIMLIKRGDIFGQWNTEWVFSYEDLACPPEETSSGIEIVLKDNCKKVIKGGNFKRLVPIATPEEAHEATIRIAEVVHGKQAARVIAT